MKSRLAFAVLTSMFYVALPVIAQGNGNHGSGGNHGDGNNGNHNGHGNNSNHSGNNSDHSGHDDDGNSAGHRQDAPHGFGDRNLMLSSPAVAASVAAAVTSASEALKSGAMTTPAGASIPLAAQAHTYSILNGDADQPVSVQEISAALSTAGPRAGVFVPRLVSSFAALRTQPSRLPTVLERYNNFTRAASSEFISSPPAEYLAMHAVLAQLVAAAGSQK